MANIAGLPATRLRQTFRHDEEDEDDEPLALDEQGDQEQGSNADKGLWLLSRCDRTGAVYCETAGAE
jgi:hypothetical protein